RKGQGRGGPQGGHRSRRGGGFHEGSPLLPGALHPRRRPHPAAGSLPASCHQEERPLVGRRGHAADLHRGRGTSASRSGPEVSRPPSVVVHGPALLGQPPGRRVQGGSGGRAGAGRPPSAPTPPGPSPAARLPAAQGLPSPNRVTKHLSVGGE